MATWSAERCTAFLFIIFTGKTQVVRLGVRLNHATAQAAKNTHTQYTLNHTPKQPGVGTSQLLHAQTLFCRAFRIINQSGGKVDSLSKTGFGLIKKKSIIQLATTCYSFACRTVKVALLFAIPVRLLLLPVVFPAVSVNSRASSKTNFTKGAFLPLGKMFKMKKKIE